MKVVDLRFPVGGLNRRYAYQQQSPFTTPACLNVRPFETIEGRERGGSRPGLAKLYSTQLGSGNPVRFVQEVTSGDSNSNVSLSKEFVDESAPRLLSNFDSDWSLPAGAAGILLTHSWNVATLPANGGGGNVYAAVLPATPEMDPNGVSVTTIQYYAPGYMSSLAHRYIYMGLDDTTPAFALDSVLLHLEEQQGADASRTVIANLYQIRSGVQSLVCSLSGSGMAYAHDVSVSLSISDTVATIRYVVNSSPWINYTANLDAQPTGTRVGIGMKHTSGTYNILGNHIAKFSRSYPRLLTVQPHVLTAAANGTVYYSTATGEMHAASGDLTVASDRSLGTAEHLGYLYVADVSEYEASGTLDDTDSQGTAVGDVFTAASVDDWSALGVAPGDHILYIFDGEGDIVDGYYEIASIDGDELTLATSTSGSAGNNCSYRVCRAPKRMSASTGTLLPWRATNGGTIPIGCPLIGMMLGRLFLGGNVNEDDESGIWYASRKYDPLDFDFSQTDAKAAVASTVAAAGNLPSRLTAIIPGSDDYGLFGCRHSIWRLNGDPAYGGAFGCLSQIIGVVSSHAWAHGPSGEVYFLSADGVYVVLPGAGTYPQSVSRERLPRALEDVDTSMHTVSMRYDSVARGIFIFITDTSGAVTQHWELNLQTGGFWPITFYSGHQPSSVGRNPAPTACKGEIVLGGLDGYLRTFDRNNSVDDNVPFSSYITYGPMRASTDPIRAGRILRIIATLDNDSDDLDIGVKVGDYAEQAVTAAIGFSREVSGGRSRTLRPRLRAGSYCLDVRPATSGLLQEDGDALQDEQGTQIETEAWNRQAWAIENLAVVTAPAGMQRL